MTRATSRASRWSCVCAAAAALLFTAALVPCVALAQRVTLRIAPPEGDTLRMQLEQHFEVQSGSSERGMSGALKVWTHAIVLRRAHGYTDLISVTDSARVFPANVALKPLLDARRALEGRTVRLRVDGNGGISMTGGPAAGLDPGPVLPSMLPGHAVAIGGTWTRDMSVPLSTTRSSSAEVRTRFRLDSLADHAAIAFISFHGAVSHDHAQDGRGATGRTVGTLDGSMQVDRRLDWITDSTMIVNVVSDIQPKGMAPIHTRMRITQSLSALAGN